MKRLLLAPAGGAVRRFTSCLRAGRQNSSGTVTSIAGSSMTVKIAGQDAKFYVDSKTRVSSRRFDQTRRAAAASKPVGAHRGDEGWPSRLGPIGRWAIVSTRHSFAPSVGTSSGSSATPRLRTSTAS
jgi:hypothetical protein